MEENNIANVIMSAVESATAPLVSRIKELEAQKQPSETQEPEIPHDIWERATRKVFGEAYKIY